MCLVPGTMPPSLGAGGSHPFRWPGPWNSLQNWLLPSRMAMGSILKQSSLFQNLIMRLPRAFPLSLELLVQQCILRQSCRIMHVYKVLLISQQSISATSIERIVEDHFDKMQS